MCSSTSRGCSSPSRPGSCSARAPGSCCAASARRRPRRSRSAIACAPGASGAVLFGGMTAGLAGAYLATIYTPLWSEGMVAGRGWIALALVVFATWHPGRVVVGAYLFGGVTMLQLFLQAQGLAMVPEGLSMLPYLATIAVLALLSRDARWIRVHMPASLGQPFVPAKLRTIVRASGGSWARPISSIDNRHRCCTDPSAVPTLDRRSLHPPRALCEGDSGCRASPCSLRGRRVAEAANAGMSHVLPGRGLHCDRTMSVRDRDQPEVAPSPSTFSTERQREDSVETPASLQ